MPTLNDAYKTGDVEAWKKYRAAPTPANRSALLHRFDGLMRNAVGKWAGPVPEDILMGEAKVLAAKSFDTYDPSKGAALSTHVQNSIQPISRTVYTYQNTVRLPENIALKMRSYVNAVSHLTAVNGHEPSVQELHEELGWPVQEINRLKSYNRRDLMESGPEVAGSFYETNGMDEDDDILLGGMYMELTPQDRRLFDAVTGYNGARKMSNPEIMKVFGLTQSQLSYRKTLLAKQLKKLMDRKSVRSRYGVR